MLTGLYLFLLLMTLGSYGQPIPFYGRILEGAPAKIFIVLDALVGLHLVIGLFKRQLLTWYLLLGYNLFEASNTVVSLLLLPHAELERAQGAAVDPHALLVTNLIVLAAIAWVSLTIYRRRELFNNRSPYLF